MNPSLQSVWFKNTKVTPSKIVCVGRNYAAHIAELNSEVPQQMVLFIKPNSSISETLIAASDEAHHYESELCFLVKDQQFVAVSFGFDLTKRAIQNKLKDKGLPWERSKSFDGAALFSQFVALPKDTSELIVEMTQDGKVIQHGGVELMIHKPQEVLQEIQSFVSLQDGDIVMTGTPEGVGELVKGSDYLGRVLSNEQVLIEHHWLCQ
ncbi:MAG: 2-keto-4-pentenoate hydratase/2-oxohepta-3-ene-1,7-dioic acid hydratase in catechol pathway [Saprospiraceae bacterium]|jgi:2-keto-4-pentenoate hydratase/2-oxohepta-3-ene-1,7-dioic acid hydratase in catechol pathway